MPRPLRGAALAATGGDAAAVREHLLAAARAIVDREGLAGASVREIAREAGVATGTLYNYFPDREALVVAAIVQGVTSVGGELAALPERAGTETVVDNLERCAQVVLEALQRIVPLASAIVADPTLLGHLRRLLGNESAHYAAREPLVAYLRREQALGRVDPDADLTAAAALLLGACHEAVFTRQLLGAHRGSVGTAALRPQIHILVSGLAPRIR
jgi:AcrR family transcriptional regulator